MAYFLQSGMSYSDDIHTAHAKSAPHPSWMKSGTCDHSFTKNHFHGKKSIFLIIRFFFLSYCLSCLREAL